MKNILENLLIFMLEISHTCKIFVAMFRNHSAVHHQIVSGIITNWECQNTIMKNFRSKNIMSI